MVVAGREGKGKKINEGIGTLVKRCQKFLYMSTQMKQFKIKGEIRIIFLGADITVVIKK